MIRMIDSLAARPAFQRIGIAMLLSLAGLFLVGLAVGVVAGMISHGHLPKRLWVVALPLVAAPLGFAALRVAWGLAVPPKTASGYEKRYWKMWMLVTALGIPVGAALAISTRSEGLDSINPFASTPISEPVALVLAALVSLFFVIVLILYHRAIDDHEERAYLWGSQLAYYFLIVAFPAWWLLERGGIVGPVTTGAAFIAILASFAVQGGVWAWLKYR